MNDVILVLSNYFPKYKLFSRFQLLTKHENCVIQLPTTCTLAQYCLNENKTINQTTFRFPENQKIIVLISDAIKAFGDLQILMKQIGL